MTDEALSPREWTLEERSEKCVSSQEAIYVTELLSRVSRQLLIPNSYSTATAASEIIWIFPRPKYHLISHLDLAHFYVYLRIYNLRTCVLHLLFTADDQYFHLRF